MAERWRPEFDSFERYLRSTKGADQLRFWQALLAWAGEEYQWNDADKWTGVNQPPDSIRMHWNGVTHLADPENCDTFYLEAKKIGPQLKTLGLCYSCIEYREEWNNHPFETNEKVSSNLCSKCWHYHTVNEATHLEEWSDGEFVAICDDCTD